MGEDSFNNFQSGFYLPRDNKNGLELMCSRKLELRLKVESLHILNERIELEKKKKSCNSPRNREESVSKLWAVGGRKKGLS